MRIKIEKYEQCCHICTENYLLNWTWWHFVIKRISYFKYQLIEIRTKNFYHNVYYIFNPLLFTSIEKVDTEKINWSMFLLITIKHELDMTFYTYCIQILVWMNWIISFLFLNFIFIPYIMILFFIHQIWFCKEFNQKIFLQILFNIKKDIM